LVKEIQPGDVIGETYKVLKVLGGEGQSGVGIVYICSEIEKDNEIGNEIVALKTLQTPFLDLEKKIKTFKKEALAWVLLDKFPYIVNANFVINLEGRPFICLEYIAPDEMERNTLTEYLKTPISLQKAVKWGIEVSFAMEHCASRGLTPHRDIKPDNIMIINKEIAKLTDFGLSNFYLEGNTVISMLDMKEVINLTQTFLRITHGEVTGGSIPWMAPEQFEGIPDMRSDIYSFGIVLYQMGNEGRRPFNKFSIRHFYQAHLEEQPRPLRSKLWPIISKCLEKDPDDRYQNFRELRTDLIDLYKKEFNEDPPILVKKEKLDASEHYNKGFSFKTLGFIDEAIEEFNQVVAQDPNHFKAYFELGVLFSKKGVHTFAMEELEKALKINPYSVEARKKKAITLREMGHLNEAVEEYRETMILDPEDVKIHLELAGLYEIMEEYDNAEMFYQNFIICATHKGSRDKKNAKKALNRIRKKLKES